MSFCVKHTNLFHRHLHLLNDLIQEQSDQPPVLNFLLVMLLMPHSINNLINLSDNAKVKRKVLVQEVYSQDQNRMSKRRRKK